MPQDKEEELLEDQVNPDPIEQFRDWFKRAQEVVLHLPNAMTLATADASGKPSARTVLLKDFDESGFVFYTNYDSPKSGELDANPRAALVFYWAELERQVRISGRVSKVSREESEAYFDTRPIDSRIGAWASNQSSVLENRDELLRRFAERSEEFHGKKIPLPPNWGGYCLAPEEIEFWLGRFARLHDRIRYRRSKNAWIMERLSP
jgi:pyridoxamine 5'-phosphate oxidase